MGFVWTRLSDQETMETGTMEAQYVCLLPTLEQRGWGYRIELNSRRWDYYIQLKRRVFGIQLYQGDRLSQFQ